MSKRAGKILHYFGKSKIAEIKGSNEKEIKRERQVERSE